MEILRKYHSSDGNPVSYGQCWVFSGVTTTGGGRNAAGKARGFANRPAQDHLIAS